ncbi:mucin-2 protein [Nocardioides sp. SR21]|uniref:mucin-2 protein n=1 Tax=Nocardioides sp. SR21 TaxID=2919501 RepID=UPI001FAB1EEA|nr:mucin-2 protein [Nocardioides sp. SR21]
MTLGVFAADPDARDLVAQDTSADLSAGLLARDTVSRADSRVEAKELQKAFDKNAELAATVLAVKRADTKLWTTAPLNLWTASGKDAEQRGEIAAGKSVLITGRKADGRVEIVVDGEARWVTEGYLSEDKPLAAAAGLSMEPCPDPGVESGLTDDAVYLYRSVCNAFPQITSYGGWDGHGEHSSGRAIDIMTSDEALGDAIAAFLLEHAGELNLYDIIWRGEIWTSVRSSEGWRAYGDHGSVTANHYDHVHVATNG